MIAVSHDPDAGTLYWYFTEIIAGSIDAEGECDSTLLLDEDGQIIGVELELDASIPPDDLAFALSHPQASYDKETYTLTIKIADVADPDAQPISDPAILDFDHVGMLQGAEVHPAKLFSLATRLERLAPFMIELDDDEDEGEDDSDQGDEADDLDASEVDDDDDDDEDLDDDDEDDDEDDEDDLDDDLTESDTNFAETAEILTEDPLDIPPIREDIIGTPRESDTVPSGTAVRSGFVALVGKPNVGKSTLLNALLGQKVAIVSPKPQTTRLPLRGILSRPDAQIIFVDTPGIHDPRTKLGSFMVNQARRAIPDADVICFVVDISEAPSRLDRRIADLVRKARVPRLLVLNKLDIRNPKGAQLLDAYRALGPWDMEIAVSALRSEGLETLLEEIQKRLPEGHALYPESQLTDQTVRELSSELVREQVLRQTEQEVPHSVAVEVEEWEEREAALYIRMSIYVEKDSQKGILIGARGAMLKQIGSAARKSIEQATGRTVYLDLWVKTRANWRDDPSSLHWLGYSDKA